MTVVKICGIRWVEHGLVALEAGADWLGFIFYPHSHRYVPPETVHSIVSACRAAHRHDWRAVGVFVNEPLETVNAIAERAGLDYVQLAGDERPEYCAGVRRPVIKVVRFGGAGTPTGPAEATAWNAARVLLDTDRPGHFGGTGEAYDWAAARPFAAKAVLAGGLTPANVERALSLARPWGLDVSSGVERDREKDPTLIRRFLRKVKIDGCVS